MYRKRRYSESAVPDNVGIRDTVSRKLNADESEAIEGLTHLKLPCHILQIAGSVSQPKETVEELHAQPPVSSVALLDHPKIYHVVQPSDYQILVQPSAYQNSSNENPLIPTVNPQHPSNSSPQYVTLVETTPDTEQHASGFEDMDVNQLNIHEEQGNTEEDYGSVEIQHPVTKSVYQIDCATISRVLEQNGRLTRQTNPQSPEVLKAVKKFCDAKTLQFMKEADAKLIIDSGYPVETVSVKKTKQEKQSEFACLFCPIIQKHTKYFPVKENLKRHYCKHLKHNRFKCQACDYASYRNDHVKDHIMKKHKNHNTVRIIDISN